MLDASSSRNYGRLEILYPNRYICAVNGLLSAIVKVNYLALHPY